MSPAAQIVEKLDKLRESVDLNRRDSEAHAKTLSALTEDQLELRKLVGALSIAREVQLVKDEHLDERLSRIETSIADIRKEFKDGNKQIRSVIVGLAVTFITAFVLAFAQWIIGGGLSSGPS